MYGKQLVNHRSLANEHVVVSVSHTEPLLAHHVRFQKGGNVQIEASYPDFTSG